MDTAKMIEAAIANEEWARDTASAEDKHFWDGWSADAVRAGRVIATVTTSARGTGHQVLVTRRLVVQGADGAVLAYVPDTEANERVPARDVRRAGGLEAYARRLVVKAYGADVPVKATHHA